MYKFPFSAPKDRHIHNTFIPYIHLTFILHLLFLRPFFVFSSSFLRLFFVHPSSFVRPSFVFSSSVRAARTVFCSSHFSVTTLPLPRRGMGRGYFIRLFIICPCGSHRLLFVSLFHYYTPSPKERDGERIFSSFFLRLFITVTPL